MAKSGASLLAIADIRADGGTQVRVGLNEDHVNEIVEHIRADGKALDPIVVFFDGKAYWLADGFHRVEAHRRTNTPQINADVRKGSQRDAVLYAVGANSGHGLKRTDADKRRAVLKLLADPEWAKWSDRAIARQCVVSPSTVGAVRAETSVQAGQIPDTRTVERGGKVFTQNTANIGKRPPPAATKPEPRASKAAEEIDDGVVDCSDDDVYPAQPKQSEGRDRFRDFDEHTHVSNLIHECTRFAERIRQLNEVRPVAKLANTIAREGAEGALMRAAKAAFDCLPEEARPTLTRPSFAVLQGGKK